MTIYRGIIEDNNHPEKNGMCRVRIFGIHPNSDDEFNKIDTSSLPWAEVMGTVENGLNSGIGLSKLPRQGTMVYVILDHNDPNKPIIIGTATGVPTESSSGAGGFADPDGVYPLIDRLGEPDTNRLVRGADADINNTINTNKSKVMDSINAGANQSEPETLSHLASYTENAVLETASGHIVEIDDTTGNERIRVVHNSGSYFEFRPDGGVAMKSVGVENNYIHTGNLNEHIQGAIKRYLESNIDEIVAGYIKRVVVGTLDEKIQGAVTEAFEAGQTTTITGDLVIGASGNVTITAGGKVTIDGGSGADLTSGGLTKVDGTSVAIG